MIPPRGALCASLLVIGVGLAGCGSDPDAGAESAAEAPAVSVVGSVLETTETAETETSSTPETASDSVGIENGAGGEVLPHRALSPLADRLVVLPSAFPERVLTDLAQPVGVPPQTISLPDLGVDQADIIGVGIEPNGELEVPGADDVGWYRFGVGVDGGQGSTVLAAHIAYNGRDGVFRNLADSAIGDEVVIDRGGDRLSYRVESIEQFTKTALPIDDLFAEDGDERLVLITCGGSFNSGLRSYDDNVVVIATPVGD